MPQNKYHGRYKEKDKEYRLKNKEKIKARIAIWREQNKEKCNASALKSYYNNREKALETKKTYYRQLIQNQPEKRIWTKVRDRAKASGIYFDLLIEDIVIPTYCPILGVEMELGGDRRTSPSVDRIDPTKGYTRDNIAIISYRANQLKSNATWQELQAIADWLKEKTVINS